jgi:hypothetical protein
LAAEELAFHKATDQMPSIMRALNNEHVDLTKINIAFALAQLGSDDGVEALKTSCADSGLRSELRLLAVRYTFYIKDKSCVELQRQVLQDPNDRILVQQ